MPDPVPNPSPSPVSLFYSYAHEDETLRNELASHLKILERRGLISAWHDRQIVAGQNWDQDIDQHLTEADLVLLLVSADFIGSDYIWGVELAQAMQRQQARQCEVVPILVRAVNIDPDDAQDLPFLKLQALPPDLKPVTAWPDRDEAWTQVAKGLRATVNLIRSRRPAAPLAPSAASATVAPAAPAAPAAGVASATSVEGLLSAGAGAALRTAAVVVPSAVHAAAPATAPATAPAAAPAARPADPQLIQMVNTFIGQVDQAQRQRGGAPLLDHSRYTLQQDTQALIDRPDGVRLLWVDDRPDNNRHERTLLARLQIEVVTARSTDEAMACLAASRAQGEPFDLVISDWSRPPEGAQAATHLAQTLREQGFTQPLVVYHGEMNPASRQRRADKARAAGALGEAVMPAELLALVQQALGPDRG